MFYHVSSRCFPFCLVSALDPTSGETSSVLPSCFTSSPCSTTTRLPPTSPTGSSSGSKSTSSLNWVRQWGCFRVAKSFPLSRARGGLGGHEHIMVGGYHGGQDWVMSMSPSSSPCSPGRLCTFSKLGSAPKTAGCSWICTKPWGRTQTCNPATLTLALSDLPLLLCSKPNTGRLGAAKSIAAGEAPA